MNASLFVCHMAPDATAKHHLDVRFSRGDKAWMVVLDMDQDVESVRTKEESVPREIM